MRIYHYDPVSGLYLGATDALPDPLELERAQQAALAAGLATAHRDHAAALGDGSDMVVAARAFEAAVQSAHDTAARIAPTVWMIPDGATTDAPPEIEAGRRLRRSGGAWVVEDAPFPTDPEAPLADEASDPSAAVRAARNRLIAQVRWVIDRHRDEVALGRSTTLTVEDYLLVLQHVQDLRDVPEQDGFPSAVDWPHLPPELLATGD